MEDVKVFQSSSTRPVEGHDCEPYVPPECEATGQDLNYWLGRTGTPNEKFVLDFGCSIVITGFEIKNSHNNLNSLLR